MTTIARPTPLSLAAEYDAAACRAEKILAAAEVAATAEPDRRDAEVAAVDWDGLAHAEELLAGLPALRVSRRRVEGGA